MSSKTIKKAIKDVLENLAKDDMNKFCSALLDRRGEPRVPVSRVEGRDYLGIADVLVSTYTEEKAAQVTMDLLQEIKCFNQAKEFESDLKAAGILLSPRTSTESRSATSTVGDDHFVDRHRLRLIQSVKNIQPILDELLYKKVISDEYYEKVRGLPTCQEKIRELYCTGLKDVKACKDIFLLSLEKNEPYLMEELKKAE